MISLLPLDLMRRGFRFFSGGPLPAAATRLLISRYRSALGPCQNRPGKEAGRRARKRLNVFLLGLRFALAAESQDVLLQVEIDVICGHTRKLRSDHDAVFAQQDVDRRMSGISAYETKMA